MKRWKDHFQVMGPLLSHWAQGLLEIICGAGPLKTNYFNNYETPIENIPNNFLPPYKFK